jgi:Xaa-Pro aminopeptidase
MSMTSLSRSESEAEIPTRRSPDRAGDVEFKQQAVADFLDREGFDALLIQQPANFAWFTAGGDNSRGGSSQTTATLFITHDARVLVTDNVNSPLLFDHQLPGLGFQLKERPWHHPRRQLVEDIVRGRNVAGDLPLEGVTDVSHRLGELRLPLTELECGRMRELGKAVAHAVEATARRFPRGATESEVAAEVAHRMIKHQVVPELIQVVSEGRRERYRHWSFDERPIDRVCAISAIGRRWGLCAGAARSVCFDSVPKEIQSSHQAAVLIHATGMHFSVAKWELKDVWDRVARIYEKFGHASEWQLASQAEVVGYGPAEVSVIPGGSFRLQPGMAVHWHPSVGAAVMGDTVLISERGIELITPSEDWPTLTVQVKQTPIGCPDILIRTEADLAGDDSVFALKAEGEETGGPSDSALT